MTLKDRSCAKNEHKDIYCIKGDVNMLREKIRGKFLASDKTFHFGDVGREEILLRKLLDHNKSKKAFIEDHLTKMKLLIQRIILLEKENEVCKSVALENKRLRQEVKYWKSHALELQKISSYPTKIENYIQELERRVYKLKEELLESFKREYKLKKIVNSLNKKEPNHRLTDTVDTLLKDTMEERKALGKEKESMKRLMYRRDEILNIDKSEEQVCPSKRRETAKRNFPGKRSKVFSEGDIPMIERLDNKEMRISKETRIQKLINEDEGKTTKPTKGQEKSQKISQKYVRAEKVTDEELLAEEDSDEDEWDERELEEQKITQKESKFEEVKVRKNFPMLGTSTSRKESLPLEQEMKGGNENEGKSREGEGILENNRKSKTLKGRKVIGKGAIALQEDDKQLIDRTRSQRESTDAVEEQMLALQGRSTPGEITSEGRTVMTKDKKLVSEVKETKDSLSPLHSIESPLLKAKYGIGKGTENKDDRHQSSVERESTPPERQQEFKTADFKGSETFLAEKEAEFPDKNTEKEPKTEEQSIPLKEIVSNRRKLGKEEFQPQESQQVKTVSEKIEVPLENIHREAIERKCEVKEGKVFQKDTNSQSRGIIFKEEQILSNDNTKAPSEDRKITFKEKLALPEDAQVKDKHAALKDKKVTPEEATTQSIVNVIMQASSGEAITHSKEREMVSNEVQDVPEDRETLPKERQTILKDMQSQAEDTATQSVEKETKYKEMKVLPKTTIAKAKERKNTQSSSKDSPMQNIDRKTMSSQMGYITEDSATQSKEREIIPKEVETHDGDETQFTGRDLLIEELQEHPKKTDTHSKERVIALKESKFNKESKQQEKKFQPTQKSEEITSVVEKAESKFEMMKRETDLMLKDAIVGGKIDLQALGSIPGKSDRGRWPQTMNRYKMANNQAEENYEMFRDVKEHSENHFKFGENMIFPTSRIPVRETQPLGMNRNCICEKHNYFLEQVLNVQETTEKRIYKENVIRTKISRTTSLDYKKEAITLEHQPCQEIVNNRIHDLIHKTERKGCEQKVSITSKIYQKDQAGRRENSFDDNSLIASILHYQNELHGAEQETDQLINIVGHLLEALGTSFKLLKDDDMN